MAHSVDATGIDAIDPAWVLRAAKSGQRVRLVGSAAVERGTVRLHVKPELVDARHPFAQIKNEENCLLVDAQRYPHSGVTQHVWTGRGAGRWPTTAAVMADLFDLYRERQSVKRPATYSLLETVEGGAA